MKLRAGIDIGGTKANIGILDETGKILAKRKIPVNVHAGCAANLESAALALKELLVKLDKCAHDVEFCGIGVPGTVSQDGRVVVKAPNLGWENEPCAALFESLTGIPAGLVQDSRAAALGEYRLGAAQGRRLVVCVTLGTGIGVGIVMDGKIFHGALGGAGEVGHIIAKPDGRPCGCGKRGCMEAYSAGKGIAQTAAEQPGWAGQAMGSEAMFDAAGCGDALALSIIQEAVELLGMALTSVVNVLSPDAIIFSGGMCRQQELYVKPLMSYIRSHAYSLSAGEGLLMATAELGEDAPMVGAALLNENSLT
jgi:glucokinase